MSLRVFLAFSLLVVSIDGSQAKVLSRQKAATKPDATTKLVDWFVDVLGREPDATNKLCKTEYPNDGPLLEACVKLQTDSSDSFDAMLKASDMNPKVLLCAYRARTVINTVNWYRANACARQLTGL